MVLKDVTFIVTIYSAIVNIDSSSLNHKYMYLRFGEIFQQYVSPVVVFSLIGSCKCNYNTITAMTAPRRYKI